ncbi:hypothetical protein WJX72_011930 [[Myrmecia] bisecta]|uniref:Vesicle transport protein n=1 Tax=[Myrmecia] bisecta TaxID=41462 RepID=A0AAW1QGN9_9CHLO
METLRGLFGQSTPDDEPSASVLAEWNKYSGDQAGPSQSDKLLDSMEGGTASVKNFLNQSFTRVTTGVQGAGTSVSSTLQRVAPPTAQQFTYFAVLLGGGVVFLVLAFTLFLPVIILAPSKFAICFTLGSVFIMAAFTSLRGWQSQITHMFSRERLPFTLGYIGSMAGTLYAALVMHSYVMSVACCAAQVVALLYYTVSYFPGGTAGMKFVFNMCWGTTVSCFHGVQKTIFR